MFALLACAPAPTPQPTTHQTASTPDLCPTIEYPTGVRRLCAETTVPPTSDTAEPVPGDRSGVGTVTELAGDGVELARLRASRPVDGFPSCEEPIGLRFRVLDGDGVTWTFGVSDPDGFASRPSDLLGLGDEITFAARWIDQPFDADGLALILSDAAGPLVVVEQAWSLEPEERAGITIQDGAGGCQVDSWYHQGFAVSCPGADAVLRSGGSVLCETEPRPMQVLVTSSGRYTDCQISCENDSWIAWVTEP